VVKKRTEIVIKAREEEKRKNDWFDQRKTYKVIMGIDDYQDIIADGYLINEGKFHEPQNLIFFTRIGDELIETARFKEWIAVTVDMDCIYKQKNP